MAKEYASPNKIDHFGITNSTNIFPNKGNTDTFFKPQPHYIQRQKGSAVTGAKTKAKAGTWQDKLAGFDHAKSTKEEMDVFYKDLLEKEVKSIFGDTIIVDVLLKGDTKCNPDHLTLMLEEGEGKLADYVAPDDEKELAAKEKRMSVDLGKSKDVKSIEDPAIGCKRIFLNDIKKDNPQKFHAAYFHESKHDENRKLYIQYFQKWKEKYKNNKQPIGFTTWINEKLVGKKELDLAVILEAHNGKTGTLFDESVAHLKTLEWMGEQKSTTEDAINIRLGKFVEYASNLTDNSKILITAFGSVYKALPDKFKTTLKEVIVKQKEPREGVQARYTTFYKKLFDQLPS